MPGETLRATAGPASGLTLPIDGELQLGRAAPGLELLAADAELSRSHASIRRDDDGALVIEDLGSRNGTWVNGARVERARLEPGDLIRVGESTFELVVGPPVSRLYDDELIRPWYEHAREVLAPGMSLVDIHGHTGFNDPDGFTFSSEQLLATLEAATARGVVMPMHEPDGYPPANDRVIAEAAASDGRLTAFCRLDPKRDAVAEARRCLDAGARGIKLHPRAEGFELRDPEVEPIFALAHERRLPLVIHAGRGIPTLARDAVDLADAVPGGADRARPCGDLRPQLALAGDPAPPEPPDRHRLVAPGRSGGAVRARAAGTARLRQRPPLLHALHVGDDGGPLRPAGRSLAGAAGRNPRAAGRTTPRWRRAARSRGRTWV